MKRSSILAGAAALATLAYAPATPAQSLTTEVFAQGLSGPVYMTQAPGDPTRHFVVEQAGRIRVILNGALLATPFINLTSAAGGPVNNSGNERGLLGLAFHPDYENNGRFFVNFTGTGGHTFVNEYAVTMNPSVANSALVRNIITVTQDFSNHNGGNIQFGPDGRLYIGMGDGGSGNDPNGRAQSQTSNLGKMLRLDIDIPAPFIPGDNPFVGPGGFNDEIWHLGLRNPWRWSFDRLTGDLFIGDVGQNNREEVSFGPAGVGGLNFGWRCMEGFNCTGLTGCTCNSVALELPIRDYPTSGGNCSVVGGYVYRGAALPSLDGTYFYADYCSGTIWSLRYDTVTGTVSEFTNRTVELRPPSGTISTITSFAQDLDGEVYIVSQSGRIFKIVADCSVTTYCQATANSTGIPSFMSTNGSTSVAANNLVMSANGLPSSGFGLFVYGGGRATVPTGQGVFCIAGTASQPVIRTPEVLMADIFGIANRPLDLTSPLHSSGLGAILPGDTWNFQYWFRDTINGQATFNFSNAIEVYFCP